MILDIILNIILGLILILSVYFGYKKGFLRMASGPIKFFAAIAITITCCAPFGRAVIKPLVHEPISNYVADYLYENCGGVTSENIDDELPTLLKLSAGLAGVDVDSVAENAENRGEAVIDAVADKLTDSVAGLISTVIGFFVLYFLLKILIGILLRVLNSLINRGVVGGVNKIIGVIFGAFFGIILAWGLVAILEFVFHSSLFADSAYISEFDGHVLYHFFKTYSPMELLLSF